jgi:hypothetical protein
MRGAVAAEEAALATTFVLLIVSKESEGLTL